MDRSVVAMEGNNPIRTGGMVTSRYPDICSQYGSSSVQYNAMDMYGGSNWCQVGIVMNEHGRSPNMCALEARFYGNTWGFRVRDPYTQLVILLPGVGQGPYGAYRNGDQLDIPGKEGVWTVQVQTQTQPYLLYLP